LCSSAENTVGYILLYLLFGKVHAMCAMINLRDDGEWRAVADG
jgi:hypothetical protein